MKLFDRGFQPYMKRLILTLPRSHSVCRMNWNVAVVAVIAVATMTFFVFPLPKAVTRVA